MIALDSYLRSGTHLGDLYAARQALIADMAADLMETGNFRVRADAVKQLHHDGYWTLDVLILVDEAIFECQQQIVARQMSDMDQGNSAVAASPSGHPGSLSRIDTAR